MLERPSGEIEEAGQRAPLMRRMASFLSGQPDLFGLSDPNLPRRAGTGTSASAPPGDEPWVRLLRVLTRDHVGAVAVETGIVPWDLVSPHPLQAFA